MFHVGSHASHMYVYAYMCVCVCVHVRCVCVSPCQHIATPITSAIYFLSVCLCLCACVNKVSNLYVHMYRDVRCEEAMKRQTSLKEKEF